MAIYNPPKNNGFGSVLQGAGSLTSTIGTGLIAGGVSAPVGIAMAGVGALLNVAGGIANAGAEAKNAEYQTKYNTRVNATNSLNASKASIAEQMSGYNKEGISSSVSAINSFLSPGSGGTGIVNKRLI